MPLGIQMPRIRGFAVCLLLGVGGCSSSSDVAKPSTNPTSQDATEKTVRAVLADIVKVNAAVIDMNQPISKPPLKANELDLVEIVMELEERFDIAISDSALDRFMERKEGVPIRITPAQLVMIVKEAPKRSKKRN
jgi:acyl carrier protein